jgi:ABC-type branched-subunit amino acid transport system ATPase component/ABC-type branched-subunit amino acid transport system permease subunit
VTRPRAILLLVGFAVVAVPSVSPNNFWVFFAAGIGISLILVASLNLAMGFTGLVSMAHTGLFAVGAYVSGLLMVKEGWPFWLSAPVAVLGAAAVGALMSLAALRAAHLYFAMITLAFNLILLEIAIEADFITGGYVGVLGVGRPSLFGLRLGLSEYFYLVWVVVGLSLVFVRNVVQSRFGRAFIALRDGEDAAAALGIPPFRTKLLSFTLSAALAGLAGALFASLNGFVNPALAGLETSLNLFIAMLLGGVGTLAGPLLGMLALTVVQQAIAPIALYQALIFGAILLLSMVLTPTGLVGTWQGTRWGRRRVGGPAAARDGAARIRDLLDVRPPAEHAAEVPALEVRGLRKSFGGIRALNGVDLDVRAGTIHGLVGPNGSGKTTLVNVVAGYYACDDGEVRFFGRPWRGQRPHEVARAGLIRIFQAAHLFGQTTVLENMLVGLHLVTRVPLPAVVLRLSTFGREERELRRAASDFLGAVGLADLADRQASSLSHGQQRLLEVARALAARPRLLILDEPATGLTVEELERLARLVREVRGSGVTVLLIEHNMGFVMGLCDWVTVLDGGERIAHGPPSAVQHDARVIEAYLGTSRVAS